NRSARPATATVPGAVFQHSGIRNKTLFSGISNTMRVNDDWKFVAATQFMHTNFENPFITNYERRTERGYGLRTYVTYKKKRVRFDAGGEISTSSTDISNSINNGGIAGRLTAQDQLYARQIYAFSKFTWDMTSNLHAEFSVSANDFTFQYRNIAPVLDAKRSAALDIQIMPNIAISYQLLPNLTIRGGISRGFSPPTIAELRASDAVVNTLLGAEQGYNYEAGLRAQLGPLFFDASIFYFKLNNAIVRRVNSAEQEFFVNAGGTDQRGFESALTYILPFDGLLKNGRVNLNYTLNNFAFRDYKVGTSDFSGNALTGVPQNVGGINTEGNIGRVNYYINFQYVSGIWLNDSNLARAKPYQLLEAKLRSILIHDKNIKLEASVGAENLLDQRYSLGNDLNAVGGRYYNSAPGRNFYFGLIATF
ncbi:MAG: TonB-dependent receptor, partial [Moraxellaceae bacterium]